MTFRQFVRTLRRGLVAACLVVVALTLVVPECSAAPRRSRKKLTEKETKKLRRRMEREYLSKCPAGTEPTGQLPPDGNKFYCQVPTRKKGMVRHGEYNHWYSNGEKRLQGEYYMGKKHGIWKTYRRDGSVKSEVIYYDGNKQEKKVFDREGNATKEVDRKAKRKERRKKNLWRHNGTR